MQAKAARYSQEIKSIAELVAESSMQLWSSRVSQYYSSNTGLKQLVFGTALRAEAALAAARASRLSWQSHLSIAR